jgi:spore maturation protein CgeB
MKILNQINYLGGVGADVWIGNGFRDAFEDMGHHFFWLTNADDLKRRIEEVGPDILMIGQDRLAAKNREVFTAWRKKGLKVVVRIDSFFDRTPEIKESLIRYDLADVYYGEVEDPWMEPFKAMTGKTYQIIPNAAHHRLHFPTSPVSRYKCDIVFLGAMMPDKREALETLLLPLREKYDVKIYGPNWTLGDNGMRLAAFASRKMGLYGLNRWISEKRISVPAGEENQLYSSAKICVNIHERGEHIKSHVVLNERTFKIPACGGFEICDFVPPLRRYFDEAEMAMADDTKGDWVKDWFEKIDYYLKHDAEREEIRKHGTARALRDHTYKNRVASIFEILGKK